MKYCEMGGILRALQATENPIGDYLKYLTSQGMLVKDGIVSSLWGVYMETLEEGDLVLGDGVFRRLGQTINIVQQMRDRERLFAVVHIEISDEEVYKRLSGRLLCRQCGNTFNATLNPELTAGGRCPSCGGELYRRNDDEDKKAIENRIQAFYRDTTPCLERLESQNLLVRVDGMRPTAEIFKEILEVIGK
ncbi:MAG: nucleoside monophosphate kinase [Candidatus Peribacteria bacterium]|jgi:adenylate kinase|nr:nucleoside monophosphate kinase [Candidatus Peribacteria bacterium]